MTSGRSPRALRDVVDFRVIAAGGSRLPTLFVPASSTMTFGLTPSSSPFSSRQRMFCDAVGAPAEIGRVPAVEVLLPVLEELRVVGGSPAAGDGVAFEVDVDAALLRFREQLLDGRAASWRRSRRG